MENIFELIKPYMLAFVPLFVALDVLGLLPIYIFFTEDVSEQQKDRVIWLSVATALAVSVGFMLLGRAVFRLLGIRVSDFLVAGGALLFVIAITDILSAEKSRTKLPIDTMGVVPLGMPLMAGPAVLTTTLILLDAHGIWPTLVGLFLNIILAGVVFKLAGFFFSSIGAIGLRAVSKLTSILLSAYAVMMIRMGLAEIFK